MVHVDPELFHQYMRGLVATLCLVLLILSSYQFLITRKYVKRLRILWLQPLTLLCSLLLSVRAVDPIGVFSIIPNWLEFFVSYEVGLLLIAQGWIYVCIQAELLAQIPSRNGKKFSGNLKKWTKNFSRKWPRICAIGIGVSSMCVIAGSVLTAYLASDGGEALRVSGCMHAVGAVLLLHLFIHFLTQTRYLLRELEDTMPPSNQTDETQSPIYKAIKQVRRWRRLFVSVALAVFGLWSYQIYYFMVTTPQYPGPRSLEEFYPLSYGGLFTLIICTYLLLSVIWRAAPSATTSDANAKRIREMEALERGLKQTTPQPTPRNAKEKKVQQYSDSSQSYRSTSLSSDREKMSHLQTPQNSTSFTGASIAHSTEADGRNSSSYYCSSVRQSKHSYYVEGPRSIPPSPYGGTHTLSPNRVMRRVDDRSSVSSHRSNSMVQQDEGALIPPQVDTSTVRASSGSSSSSGRHSHVPANTHHSQRGPRGGSDTTAGGDMPDASDAEPEVVRLTLSPKSQQAKIDSGKSSVSPKSKISTPSVSSSLYSPAPVSSQASQAHPRDLMELQPPVTPEHPSISDPRALTTPQPSFTCLPPTTPQTPSRDLEALLKHADALSKAEEEARMDKN